MDARFGSRPFATHCAGSRGRSGKRLLAELRERSRRGLLDGRAGFGLAGLREARERARLGEVGEVGLRGGLSEQLEGRGVAPDVEVQDSGRNAAGADPIREAGEEAAMRLAAGEGVGSR